MSDNSIPSLWPIILTDWYHGACHVTLTLRSGVQFTGRIRKHPSESHDHVALEGARVNGNQVHHDVQLSEIVAITAVAQ